MSAHHRILGPLLILVSSTFACSFHDVELGAPDLEVSLSLDEANYRIGDAMIAELTVKNVGEDMVSVPMASSHTTQFWKAATGTTDALHVEFLDFAQEGPEFTTIDPGDEHTRMLVLPRATVEGGDYTFFAVYKSELAEEMEGYEKHPSNRVEVSISPPTRIHRDSEGRLVRDEAIKAAAMFFSQPADRIETQLLFDTNYGMYVWLCTANLPTPDEKGRSKLSCFVNAYLGQVMAMSDEHVDPAAGPSS